MPKLKKRVIYISDADWQRIREDSSSAGVTMSEIVRDALTRKRRQVSTMIDSRAAAHIRPGEPALDPDDLFSDVEGPLP